MTPTPCCSGIIGKTPGVYALDANTTVIVPDDSKKRSSNRGVLRHSNLTNREIEDQCASRYFSGAWPFTTQQEDAYDKCVSDKKAERASTRIQTYQNIAEWFACAFMGICKKQTSSGQPPSGQPSSGQPPSGQPPSGQPPSGQPSPSNSEDRDLDTPEPGMSNIVLLWVGAIVLLLILMVLTIKFFGKKGG